MSAIVTAIIALLTNLLPIIESTSTIAKAIEVLVQILPLLVREAKDLSQPVKNIIAALKSNPAATSDQLLQLQSLDRIVDSAFESAATFAADEDK